MDPLAGTQYEGWTREELEARLEEVEAEIEDTTNQIEAAHLEREIEYLELEGFIEIEDGRIYPKEEPWCAEEPIES